MSRTPHPVVTDYMQTLSKVASGTAGQSTLKDAVAALLSRGAPVYPAGPLLPDRPLAR